MHATGTAQYGCIHIIMLPPMHARVSMKFSKGWFSGRVLAHRTLIDKRESTIAEFQVCFDDGEVTTKLRGSIHGIQRCGCLQMQLVRSGSESDYDALSVWRRLSTPRVARIVATVPGAIMNPFESAAHVHEPAR